MDATPDPLPELPDDNADEADVQPDSGRPPSVATQLVELARDRYTLGVTTDSEAYAVPAGGGHVVMMLRDARASLRGELAREFFREHHKAPSSSALTDALAVLDGFAREEQPVDVYLRTAANNDVVYIDIGDVQGSVVRISGDGWSVIDNEVPVRFRRTRLTGELPVPARGGRLEELWSILNIDETFQAPVLAYMVAAFIQPDAPHPVLTFFAEQGSGKSSATRRIVDILDPSPVPLRKPPRDLESWVVAASGSWVVALDNLSVMPDWFSDSLCRACTGDGDVKRALYTDASLAVVKFRRCVIANGIDVGALRGDLSERLLSVPLFPIPPEQRLREQDIEDRWAAMRPAVFGALLDLCAATMKVLPTVEIAEAPRMADFATLLAAVDRVMGTEGLKQYLHGAETAAEDSLSADPFIIRLREVVTEPFVGTANDLLARVQPTRIGLPLQPPRGWPRMARDVTRSLKRNAPALRSSGWAVTNDGGRNQNSIFQWTIIPPTVEDVPGEATP